MPDGGGPTVPIRIWNTIELVVISLCGLAGLTFAMIQIVTRYAFPAQFIDWAEEVIVYLIIWGIWLSASQLVHENRHVRADLVVRLFPARLQRMIEIANTVAAIFFCGLIAYVGIDIVTLSYDLDERSVSSLRMPLWLYFACVPVGTGLMAVRYVIRLWKLLFRYHPADVGFSESSHAH